MIANPARLAPVLALILGLLAGCMLTPGRFVSDLDVRRDGHFTFTYRGEIHLMALSKLMDMDRAAQQEFAAKPCFTTEGGVERDCTAAELAEQRRVWQEDQDHAAASRRKNADQMKAMLGGIDPADPRAAEEFAQRLRRQAGWKRVAYKGDGLFDVEFAITGTLTHDFRFPSIERFPVDNAFVQVSLRADNTVRIDAPGFGPAAGGEPMRNLMQMAAMGAPANNATPRLPQIDGTFTVRTDAVVIANNTDEGPRPDSAGHVLSWSVTPRSPAAPMALIRLNR